MAEDKKERKAAEPVRISLGDIRRMIFSLHETPGDLVPIVKVWLEDHGIEVTE